ncbi:MAG TPA: CYTH domain-containing protein [Metalysinibacillus jejuensis]|uniref:CYTH domain-containing protein n=1 Tax=Metalysinibacillus jejuensis TaxID=914327 RepID=A0A921NBL7_9BACL|nr:CYTH domain-containing protein [Metalysinibacillus jejuensis]
MKETEIEFKNMITKEEYDQLLQDFNVRPTAIQQLANAYFDTPDFAIKALRSALRIRQHNDAYTCTLKQATSANTSTEINIAISEAQAHALKSEMTTLPTAIATPLAEQGIDIAQITCFGTLRTARVELPYKGGLLVFDHTFYLQQEDYEVEYETEDEREGQLIFQQFLQKYQLPVRHAQKKIARFSAALQAQKGQD